MRTFNSVFFYGMKIGYKLDIPVKILSLVMQKKCVLVSGPTVVSDKELENALKKSAEVLKNADNANLKSIIRKQKVDLILIEVIQGYHNEIEMIQDIKSQFPSVKIILVNGDGNRELIAEAFKYGIKDAFRKPYDCDLLVERVKALMIQ